MISFIEFLRLLYKISDAYYYRHTVKVDIKLGPIEQERYSAS